MHICSLLALCKTLSLKDALERDPVWKIFRRRIPYHFRDDLLNLACYYLGCVPWVDVPNEFCWLCRNHILSDRLRSSRNLICCVFPDFVSSVLGSFSKTPCRAREDVDTSHVIDVCLLLYHWTKLLSSFVGSSLSNFRHLCSFNVYEALAVKTRTVHECATHQVRDRVGKTVVVTIHDERPL